MIDSPVLHPQLLEALACAGHGAQVALLDANFPVSTATAATATIVHLNLARGRLTVTDLLEVLTEAVPVEALHLMGRDDGGEHPLTADIDELYRGHFPVPPVEALERFEFYRATRGPNLAVAVVSGDVRPFANALITIGVGDQTRKALA